MRINLPSTTYFFDVIKKDLREKIFIFNERIISHSKLQLLRYFVEFFIKFLFLFLLFWCEKSSQWICYMKEKINAECLLYSKSAADIVNTERAKIVSKTQKHTQQ